MLTATQNFSLLIFGASGALAQTKIFPALYEMELEGRLPVDYTIWGFARTTKTHEEFRLEFAKSVKAKREIVDDTILNKLLSKVFYFTGQYTDPADYQKFAKEINNNFLKLVYFSVPPSLFEIITSNIAVGFESQKQNLRLIIEKPFGTDYESAKELKKTMTKNFPVEQLFLLDHYLGKESVFNLLSLRLANSVFSNLLQGKYIDNVQITAFENIGLDGRAGYFNAVGTLKDMVQSHLLQILTFLTMYIPREFTAELVHQSKQQLLENMYFDGDPKHIVRGQYQGYTNEPEVDKNSQTETFTAVKLFVDNHEWHGVPFYLRTGKCLSQKSSYVVIEFKPHSFQKSLSRNHLSNKLVIELQPNEKIEFYLLTKRAGVDMEFVPLNTGKPIYCSGDCQTEHARLLLDVIRNDKLLFLDFPEIYEAWKVVDPIAKLFKDNKVPLEIYDCKSNGPESANQLIEWFNYGT